MEWQWYPWPAVICPYITEGCTWSRMVHPYDEKNRFRCRSSRRVYSWEQQRIRASNVTAVQRVFQKPDKNCPLRCTRIYIPLKIQQGESAKSRAMPLWLREHGRGVFFRRVGVKGYRNGREWFSTFPMSALSKYSRAVHIMIFTGPACIHIHLILIPYKKRAWRHHHDTDGHGQWNLEAIRNNGSADNFHDW